MSLQIQIKPLNTSFLKTGFPCVICDEWRFETRTVAYLFENSQGIGFICSDCIAQGLQKAISSAYSGACDLRRESDQKFELAAKIALLNEKDWPNYQELNKMKRGKK